MKIYYLNKPDYEWVEEGKLARLKRDFHFHIDNAHCVIKAGFEWDGASIPFIMRWKYGTPFDKVHLVGGLVHDAIYGDAVYDSGNAFLADFTRFEADNIYYSLIREYGAVMLRAFKEWAAVRAFGGSHWTKR